MEPNQLWNDPGRPHIAETLVDSSRKDDPSLHALRRRFHPSQAH